MAALTEAIAKGEYLEINQLISKGQPVNGHRFDQEGKELPSPLHTCILHFHDPEHAEDRLGILTHLITRGADVNDMRCGKRPLHLAAALQTDAVALALLRAGADPSFEDGSGRTAIAIAESEENEATLALLVIRDLQLRILRLKEEISFSKKKISSLKRPDLYPPYEPPPLSSRTYTELPMPDLSGRARADIILELKATIEALMEEITDAFAEQDTLENPKDESGCSIC